MFVFFFLIGNQFFENFANFCCSILVNAETTLHFVAIFFNEYHEYSSLIAS